jgi:glycopeptide antibiotics resistance protein
VQGIVQAWRDHGVTIVVSLLALPVAVLLGWRALPRWRAEILIVAGTLPWLVMAFAPQPAPSAIDLVPLNDLATQAADAPAVLVAQVVGNLLFLAAFGFVAPIRWPGLAGPVRLLAAGAALSTAIEVIQYVLDVGRVSSMDDVLINATGALLAGLASRRWWAITRNPLPEVGATPVR